MLCMQAREAELGRVLGERDGTYSETREAFELCEGQVDVPIRQQSERDEPSRVLAAPRLHVPIVVRPDQDVREVLVLCFREDLPAESWERREAHRRQHTVCVHV